MIVNTIDQNTKIFNLWIDNIDENGPKVLIDSIDRYYWYRSIDPSPIVPIYGSLSIIYFLTALPRQIVPTGEIDKEWKGAPKTVDCNRTHMLHYLYYSTVLRAVMKKRVGGSCLTMMQPTVHSSKKFFHNSAH